MSLETIRLGELALNKESRLLDVGSGEGRHSISAHLISDAVIFGLDANHDDLQTAKSRLHEFQISTQKIGKCVFIQGNAFNLPFPDNHFTHIICSEVLEHLVDYKKALIEINRVLKPGGTLAVSVPSFFPEWVCWLLSSAYHEMPGGHLRIFREKKLKQEIKDLGFSFQKRHRAHSLHVPYWWLKCLFWGQAETNSLIHRYHDFLVWDLMQKPRITRWMETFLDPLLGKSVAMYFCKPKN